LADLGEEIANTADFIEMVRTSLHLLLGTLAIRRGAVVECPAHLETTNPLALWGLGENYDARFEIDAATKQGFLDSGEGVFAVAEDETLPQSLRTFLQQHQAEYREQLIELFVPLIVRGQLTGLVLLGGKASGDPFSVDDIEVIHSMVRHI